MFKVRFTSIFHELVTFHPYWFIVLLHNNINFHVLNTSLHNHDSLMGVRFILWWWTGWFWTQPVLGCWWLSSYLHLWLLNWLWQYVNWAHWLMLTNELLLGHNLKRGLFKLLCNNLLFLFLLNRLWFWRVNKRIFLWQGKLVS